MRKYLAVALLALSTACVPTRAWVVHREAVVLSNAARMSIEGAQATALLMYREHQESVIERVLSECGDGPECRDDASRTVLDVRRGWQPVWSALDRAQKAHAGLVQALDAAEDVRAIAEAVAELQDSGELVADLLAAKRKDALE